MKKRLVVKFLVFYLVVLGFILTPKSYATEYEGDGTYLLHVSDRIKASNGYIIELEFASGAIGSRSDWLTVLRIFNMLGEEVDRIWSWGNCTHETDTLHISIERYVEGEAVITITSIYETTPELSHALNLFVLIC